MLLHFLIFFLQHVKIQTQNYKLVCASWFGHFMEFGKFICSLPKFFYQHWALTPKGNNVFQLILTSAYFNER